MIYTMFMDKMAPGILRLSVMDNDLDLFEGQYPVPQGVSYNSYLIEDDRLCLLDTVDARKQEEWLAGLDEVLAGRKLDYLVISHMEPDHAGSIAALCARQPQLKLVANARTFAILDQFSGDNPLAQERVTVADGGALALGSHTLHFVLAPMVHWPEVMAVYEDREKVLFSADGFGNFGSLTDTDAWADEARRYYSNVNRIKQDNSVLQRQAETEQALGRDKTISHEDKKKVKDDISALRKAVNKTKPESITTEQAAEIARLAEALKQSAKAIRTAE